MQGDAHAAESIAADVVLEATAIERLAYVARGGDPTLVSRLVALFLEDTPDRLSVLREAVDRQDEAAVQAVAHGLRGSSETFGARDMVEQCRFLEHMSGRWDDASVRSHLEALIGAFARTRTALESLVAQHET